MPLKTGLGLTAAVVLVIFGAFPRCLISSGAEYGQRAAAPPDTMALVAVRTLLDGWRKGDTVAVSAVLHPLFRLVTLREHATPQEEVQLDTRERLLGTSARLSPGTWDIRLLSPEVRSSGDGIATVWSEYHFFLHGKLSHCGVESYQLYQVRAGWQIVSFADTHHSCPAQ